MTTIFIVVKPIILELLLFAELCYLSSLNDKSDKRFCYLIEAIKEN